MSDRGPIVSVVRADLSQPAIVGRDCALAMGNALRATSEKLGDHDAVMTMWVSAFASLTGVMAGVLGPNAAAAVIHSTAAIVDRDAAGPGPSHTAH